jgi:hypothetical protein
LLQITQGQHATAAAQAAEAKGYQECGAEIDEVLIMGAGSSGSGSTTSGGGAATAASDLERNTSHEHDQEALIRTCVFVLCVTLSTQRQTAAETEEEQRRTKDFAGSLSDDGCAGNVQSVGTRTHVECKRSPHLPQHNLTDSVHFATILQPSPPSLP